MCYHAMSRLLPASQNNLVFNFDLSAFLFVPCSLNQRSLKFNHDSLLISICKVVESTFFGNTRDMLHRALEKIYFEFVFWYMTCNLQHSQPDIPFVILKVKSKKKANVIRFINKCKKA